jgi:hypothetical protein
LDAGLIPAASQTVPPPRCSGTGVGKHTLGG